MMCMVGMIGERECLDDWAEWEWRLGIRNRRNFAEVMGFCLRLWEV